MPDSYVRDVAKWADLMVEYIIPRIDCIAAKAATHDSGPVFKRKMNSCTSAF
jgi:hypothetical protein